MRLHYLQHVWFEDLGVIEDWAKNKDFEISKTALFENYKLPSLSDFDFLVVMGGPMGIDDEEKYPWLGEEKEFIKKAITSGKHVLGVCLGAQLIANVLGAKVYKNANKEIGWFKLKKVSDNFDFSVDEFMAFHWHGDTFDLPGKSIRLFESTACKNQAFLYNNKVLALQFHLEVKAAGVGRLIEECADELVGGDYIQSPGTIFEKLNHLDSCNKLMYSLLDNLTNNT
tara:strand:+ start:559 stop:1239 length:681 start_codon:yes stop_codon:yes gene_type:complete